MKTKQQTLLGDILNGKTSKFGLVLNGCRKWEGWVNFSPSWNRKGFIFRTSWEVLPSVTNAPNKTREQGSHRKSNLCWAKWNEGAIIGATFNQCGTMIQSHDGGTKLQRRMNEREHQTKNLCSNGWIEYVWERGGRQVRPTQTQLQGLDSVLSPTDWVKPHGTRLAPKSLSLSHSLCQMHALTHAHSSRFRQFCCWKFLKLRIYP